MEKLNGLSQLVQSLTEKETNLNTSLSGEESAEQVSLCLARLSLIQINRACIFFS